MPRTRRASFRSRLADLERRAERDRGESHPRVVVYLPRKDGDSRPLGVASQTGRVLTVFYDPAHPDPPLPDGW